MEKNTPEEGFFTDFMHLVLHLLSISPNEGFFKDFVHLVCISAFSQKKCF
jgi:hypothetical protein